MQTRPKILGVATQTTFTRRHDGFSLNDVPVDVCVERLDSSGRLTDSLFGMGSRLSWSVYVGTVVQDSFYTTHERHVHNPEGGVL
jgi:hypothetical protein